jgi:hypothetical protein
MKKCCKCNIEKEFCEFNKKSSSKDGHHPSCKECRKIEFKLYYKQKKIELLKYQKEYYSKNTDKVKDREREKRKSNPEIFKKYELKRKTKRKEYYSKYFLKRRENDNLFKMSGNLRNRINKFIKNKSKSTEIIIGISFDKLKIYLESKFIEGMTWSNYGFNGWHIDHIIPLSSAQNEEEMYKLCHYTNLQPLWAEENLRKGKKINYS